MAKTISRPLKGKLPWLVAKPRWPLAWELATLGTPIGVAFVQLGDGWVAVVVVDSDGEIFELKRLTPDYVVRWCLRRHVRIHHSLGHLVDEMHAGRCIGWVHDRIIEHRPAGKGSFAVYPVPFVCVLPGEPPVPGAVELDDDDIAPGPGDYTQPGAPSGRFDGTS